jgi:hypothetical protein
MVSATGDWTRNTMVNEGPMVQEVYERLYGVPKRHRFIQIDAPHNYNRDSREAVYAWFAHWLIGESELKDTIEEIPYQVDPTDEIRIFPERGPVPSDLTPERLLTDWKARCQEQQAALWPMAAEEMPAFQQTYATAFRRVLGVSEVDPEAVVVERVGEEVNGRQPMNLGWNGCVVPAEWHGNAERPAAVTVVVHPEGMSGAQAGERAADEAVLAFDPFLIGAHRPTGGADRKRDQGMFLAFHPTDDSCRVQDVLIAIAAARQLAPEAEIRVEGTGAGAAWAILARGVAGADAVAELDADFAGFALDFDQAWIDHMNIPAIRRIGGLQTAIGLAAPGRLSIRGAYVNFPKHPVLRLYGALDAGNRLTME